MYDIVDKISTILHQQTCPVYWPQDADADTCALKEALELLDIGDTRRGESPPTMVDETDLKHICKPQTFARIAPSLPRLGKTDAGHDRVDALALRRAVLRQFDNDAVRWVVSGIQERISVRVPEWFARAALPVPHGEKMDFRGYGTLWNHITSMGMESYVGRDVIVAAVRESLGNVYRFNKMLEKKAELLSSEAVQVHCIKIMSEEGDDGKAHPAKTVAGMVADGLKRELGRIEDEDKVDVVSRARDVHDVVFPPEDWGYLYAYDGRYLLQYNRREDVRDIIYPPLEEWVGEYVDRACAYIATGVPEDFCKKLRDLKNAGKLARLRQRAQTLGADFDELRNQLDWAEMAHYADDDEGEIDELEDMLDSYEEFRKHDMIITDWQYDWDDRCVILPRGVTHATTGLTTYHDFFDDMFWEDAAELQKVFVRQNDLITELAKLGLQVPAECYVCEKFVLSGTYVGPEEFVDEDRPTVEKVVDLVVEMDYLNEHTQFDWYDTHVMDSEMAKRGAVYAADNGEIELPRRLKAMRDAKGEDAMRESYEACETSCDIYGD
jgi:hypothetical protein